MRSNSAARTGAARAPERDALWRAGVRSALAKALLDDDEQVVAAAVLALGKGGDAADVPIVRAIAIDADRGPPEREHAAVALGLLGADTTRDAASVRATLQGIASDPESSDRLQALSVLALGLRRDADAVPFLVQCARRKGSSWDVPAAGLTALGLSGSEAAREELERLLADGEPMRRVYAAHGLARLADPASLPALVAALRDERKEVRRAAALAVGAVAPERDPTAVRALRRLVERDEDRGVRSTAVVTLGHVGGDEALGVLRHAYEKDDASVRSFAAIAIGMLARRCEQPRLAAPLLHDLRRGARQELRGAICVAVGLARLGEAAPELRALVAKGGNPRLVAHAALALGLVGDREKGPELLRTVLRESNDNVLRGEVARALGMLGDVRTLVALDEMAERGGTEHERVVGCLALGNVGGPECATLLTEILADEARSRVERHMAGNALGLLLDESAGRRTGSIHADLDWHLFTPTVIDVLSEM